MDRGHSLGVPGSWGSTLASPEGCSGEHVIASTAFLTGKMRTFLHVHTLPLVAHFGGTLQNFCLVFYREIFVR